MQTFSAARTETYQTQAGARRRILIVDGEDDLHHMLWIFLNVEDYEIVEGHGLEFVMSLGDVTHDLIILVSGPDRANCRQVIQALRQCTPAPILLLDDGVAGMDNLGADDCLARPVAIDHLLACIRTNLAAPTGGYDRLAARRQPA